MRKRVRWGGGGSYSSIQRQQDGVTFDVTVNNALRVEIS